ENAGRDACSHDICSKRTALLVGVPEGAILAGEDSRPQRHGVNPGRGRQSASLGGVVFVHDRLRDAASFADLLASRPGPGADLGAALPTQRAALLAAGSTTLRRCLAGGLNKRFERSAELSRVFTTEVDLIGGTVDSEGDRLLSLTSIEVIDE